MSMRSIRRAYGVPAKRGMRIAFRGKGAVITGTTSVTEHLRIRIDGEKSTCAVHPTWEIEYPNEENHG